MSDADQALAYVDRTAHATERILDSTEGGDNYALRLLAAEIERLRAENASLTERLSEREAAGQHALNQIENLCWDELAENGELGDEAVECGLRVHMFSVMHAIDPDGTVFKRPYAVQPRATALRAEIERLRADNEELRLSRDRGYRERNMIVAALSRLYPSYLAKHPDSDESWERDWMTIVFVETPEGQLSWHMHDSDVPLFAHLQWDANRWDGHSTDEKYARLEKLRAEGGK